MFYKPKAKKVTGSKELEMYDLEKIKASAESCFKAECEHLAATGQKIFEEENLMNGISLQDYFPEDCGGLPVYKMHRRDFEKVGCSHYVSLAGMSWIGNINLWRMGRKNRIGVFADCYSSGRIDAGRSQWAIQMGQQKNCIVGIFNSWTEREILRLHLRSGGKAIWILGTAFPKLFNKDCVNAIYEGRLLVVSCFWVPEWTYATYRYCCQLVPACASSLVFWSIDHTRYSDVVYRRALDCGMEVKLFSS